MKISIYILLLLPIISFAQTPEESVTVKLDTIPTIDLKYQTFPNHTMVDIIEKKEIIESFKSNNDSAFITSNNRMYLCNDSTYRVFDFNFSDADVELMGLDHCEINTPHKHNYFLDSFGTNGLFLKIAWTGFKSTSEHKVNGLTIIDLQSLKIVFQGIVSYSNWDFKRVEFLERVGHSPYLRFQSNDLIPEENYFYFYKHYHTGREIYELKNGTFLRVIRKN